MMRSALLLLGVTSLALGLSACSECAGTPSCSTQPIVSMTGRFISHRTGAPIGNVSVEWIWRNGTRLDIDVIRAVSDADGYFTIKAGSGSTGLAGGDMTVTPPAPWLPYVIRNVVLSASQVRGEGGVLGTLVVDPYLILIGELRDSQSGNAIPGARVIMNRVSGGRLADDRRSFTTDGDGRFAWIEPRIIIPEPITATFDIRLPDGRQVRLTQVVPIQYTDQAYAFVLLLVGE
jgi:hypothetical protein